MADMNTALRAEGQRTMIIGDRVAERGTFVDGRPVVTTQRWVNTVTSNSDGSVGYQIEGNNPRAEQSTEVCIAARLTNVRILDARRSEVPSDALLGGRFDNWITTQASDGTRPMVVADTVFGSGATLRYGRPIVVVGNLSRGFGAIATRQDNTAPEMLVQLASIEYTPAALERLGATRVAAASAPSGGGSSSTVTTLAAIAPR
ncbi:hypothetical protein [Sphingorhabdus sp.]|uniref:hypothetical protein n=1 Tax=Sphingorhabdus sp. TaxID=1902408 RepID=UPI0032B85C5C